MILFSRKIRCENCGKGFKAKRQRGKVAYVCGGYDNHGICKREVIYQKDLVELLQRRYGEEFDISKKNVQEVVEGISVKDKLTFTIKLKDDKPIVFGENYIEY